MTNKSKTGKLAAKRIISLALSIMMLMTVIPFGAFAEAITTPASTPASIDAGDGSTPAPVNNPGTVDPDDVNKEFTVTFKLTTTDTGTTYTFTDNTVVSYPGSVNPDHPTDAANFIFNGWDTDLTTIKYDATAGASNNTVVTANWIAREASYDVTVNFISGGTVLANAFTSNVKEGFEFQTGVAVPTFTDYEFSNVTVTYGTATAVPYTNIQNNEVLNGDKITANTVINVYYTAKNATSYTVEHHYADATGAYVKDDSATDNLTAAKGEVVSAQPKPGTDYVLNGSVIPTPITNNGQTIFLNYDRAISNIVFNSTGGSVVDPISQKWGTALTTPNAPTRVGYDFLGWTDGTNTNADITALLGTMPKGDAERTTTLTAVWQGQEVDYTVLYWVEKENLDDGIDNDESLKLADETVMTNEDYYIFHSSNSVKGTAGTLVPQPAAPANLNHFEYAWTEDLTNLTINGDGSTTVNVYYTRVVYELSFQFNGAWLYYDGILYTDGSVNSEYQTDTYKNNLSTAQSTYIFNAKLGDDITTEWPTRTGLLSAGVAFEASNNYHHWKYPSNVSSSALAGKTTGLKEIHLSDGMLPIDGDTTLLFTELTAVFDIYTRILYYYEATDAELATLNPYTGDNTSKDQLTRDDFDVLYTAISSQVSAANQSLFFTLNKDKTQIMRYSGGLGQKAVLGFTSIRTPNSFDSASGGGATYGNDPDTAATQFGNFYYARNRFEFSYNLMGGELAGYTVIDGKHTITDVKYGEPFNYPDKNGNTVLMTGLLDDTVTPTKAGYDFAGWYITEDPGAMNISTKFDAATSNATMPNSNFMVYAKWDPKTYEVNLDPANIANQKHNEIIKNDTPFEETVATTAFNGNPTPDNASEVFAGWYEITNVDEYLKGVAPKLAATPYLFGQAANRDVYLLAVYSQPTTSYIIKYVSGANSYTMPAEPSSIGTTIPIDVPTSTELAAPPYSWPTGDYTFDSVSAEITSSTGTSTETVNANTSGDYEFALKEGSNVITVSYSFGGPEYHYQISYVDENDNPIAITDASGATIKNPTDEVTTQNKFETFNSIAIPNYTAKEATKTVAMQEDASSAQNPVTQIKFVYEAVPKITYQVQYLAENLDANGNGNNTYSVYDTQDFTDYPGTVTITEDASKLKQYYSFRTGNVLTKTVAQGTIFYVFSDVWDFVDLSATAYTGTYDASAHDRLTALNYTQGATLSIEYTDANSNAQTTADPNTIEQITNANVETLAGVTNASNHTDYAVTITATAANLRPRTVTVYPLIEKAPLTLQANDVSGIVYGTVYDANTVLHTDIANAGHTYTVKGSTTASGFLGSDSLTSLGLTASYSTDAINTSPVSGSPYDVIVTLSDTNGTVTSLQNYRLSFHDGDLTLINSDGLTATINAYNGIYDADPHAPIESYSVYLDGTLQTSQDIANKGITLTFEYSYDGTNWTQATYADIQAQQRVTNVWEATGLATNSEDLSVRLTASLTNYNPHTATAHPSIAKADLNISVDAIADIDYAQAKPNFTITENFQVNQSVTPALSDLTRVNVPVDSSYVAGNNVGTYDVIIGTLTPVTPGDRVLENYNQYLQNGSFDVNQIPLTITLNNFTLDYYDAVPSLVGEYTITGFAQGFDTQSSVGIIDSDIQSSTDYTQGSPKGSYRHYITDQTATTTALSARTLNYTFHYVEGSITVNPLPLTLTAGTQTVEYGEVLTIATLYTFTGFVANENEATYNVTAGDVVLTTPYTVGDNAGTYADTVTVEPTSRTRLDTKLSNYTVTYVNADTVVTKAPIAVTAGSYTRAVGAANPPLGFVSSGYKLGQDAGSIGLAVTVTTTADIATPAGVYPVIAQGPAETTNYTVVYLPGTITLFDLAVPPVPPVDPPEPVVEIPETDIPEGDEPETDEPAEVEIEETVVPQAAIGDAAWALVNLLLTIATAIISIVLLIRYFGKKDKNKEDEEDENMQNASTDDSEEDEKEIKRKGIARLLSVPVAILAIVVFILTEDMRLPMILVDRWTLTMAIIFGIQVIVALVARKKKEEKDEEDLQEA